MFAAVFVSFYMSPTARAACRDTDASFRECACAWGTCDHGMVLPLQEIPEECSSGPRHEGSCRPVINARVIN